MLNNSLKTCAVFSIVTATFASFPVTAIAQAEVDEEIEEIVVTGSRITRRPAENLLPTVAIDGEYLDRRGSLNLGEAINEIPLFSSTGIGDTDFNQSEADVGLTFVDLFGLGTQRTLTLVNGKRVVSSAAPQPNRSVGTSGLQVDINSIPTALVERIDTVTIGGAPIYGADAIAGTVNVVLRDDFEGLELDLQGGQSGESDAENVRARMVFGSNLADDRGNIAVAVEYSERNGLLQNARPGANDIQLTNPLLATDPIGFFTANPPLPLNTFQTDTGFPGVSQYGTPAIDLLGFGAPAVFGDIPLGFLEDGATGDILMFDEGGNLIPVGIGNGNGTYLFSQNQPDFPGLYRQLDFTPMLNDIERVNAMTLGHYDISDSVRLTVLLRFSELDAAQPVGQPVVAGTPFFNLSIPVASPFINPDARAKMNSGVIAGSAALFGAPFPFLLLGPNITVGRTLSDLGTAATTASGTNWSGVLGLEGDFEAGDREFTWSLSYSQGRAKSSNVSGAINAARFGLATDVVMVDPGADGVAGAGDTIILDSSTFADIRDMTFDASRNAWVDGATGQQIVCRSRVEGAAGATQSDIDSCMPYSPFGAYNDAATIDYLSALSTLDTEIEQRFIQGNITGDLFDMPAGPLQFAAGFEYREEESSFRTDPLTQSGGLVGASAGSPDVAGEFDSTEFYAEFVVPLLSNEFVEQLNFEGAYRRIDNSIAGSDDVWTAGIRAAFAGGVTLRGNQTRSVRAPSIAELFAGQSPLFTGVADPCANSQISGGPNPSARAANCADAVVAAGIAPDTATAQTWLASYTGAITGVPGSIGGNVELENEKADSWTIGVAWQPTFVDGLVVALDYQEIEIEDAIENFNGSQVVAACYDSSGFPGTDACGQFTRDGASFILTGYQAGFINSGLLDFAGYTFNLAYGFDVGPGTIDIDATAFRLEKYDSSTDGFDVTDNVDLVGREKLRGQFALTYSQDKWTAQWQANYVQGGWLDAAARDNDGTSVPLFEFAKTDSQTIHNLYLGYDFSDRYSARFIVNNLTKETQPNYLTQFASVQARIGRTYVLGLNARF